MPGRGMKKISEYSVRPFEMDYFHYLPPSSLMRVTGSAAFAALLKYGYGYPMLRSHLGATWMLGMLEFHVFEDVQAVDHPIPLNLYASPLYCAPSTFMVRSEARREDRTVAYVDVCCMVVSVEERHALHTQDVCAVLGTPDDMIRIPAPTRLMLPEEMEFVQTHTVQYYDCDYNQHMNAYRYVDLVCQAAGYWADGAHRKISNIRMEYDAECRPGEVVSLYRKDTDDGIYVKGVKADGRLSFKSLIRMGGSE